MVISCKKGFIHFLVIFKDSAHTELVYPNTDLGNKDQTESDGATKDDHQRYNAELDIGLIPGQKRHCSANNAHNANIIHTHPDVFAVVESRDAHVPGLPGQETAKQLSGTEEEKQRTSLTVMLKQLEAAFVEA